MKEEIRHLLLASALLMYLTSCEISINKNHVAEGTKLMSQGDYFNAALEFDDALFADKKNLDALRGKYYCAMQMGYTDKAMNAANKFIELKPDSAVGYNDRGTIFMLNKDYEIALNDFNKVLEIGTDYPLITYFNKGEALRELKRYAEAIECYKVVTSKSKNDARAFFKLGQSYFYAGMKDSSCSAYKVSKDLGDQEAAKEFETNCK